jgi:alpha-tubulin suppressor-like RCC1 family protein
MSRSIIGITIFTMKNILLALQVLAFGSMPLLAQPVITQQPTNLVVPTGSSASVSVTASGINLTYQWIKDGVILTGQTGAAINFTSFQFTTCGSYQVVVSNPDGIAISTPALVSTTEGGSLWAMGANAYHQFGDGLADRITTPVSVASNVVAIAAGTFHSLFIKLDGTLWAMGDNSSGQLGDGTPNSKTAPELVASNAVAIAAGGGHSLFIKSDGTLWAMGANNYGQLGDGMTNNQTAPELVASHVIAIAAGGRHSLFIKSDGTLWAMGANNYGQLGAGTTNDQTPPVLVAGNVVAVAARLDHSLFIKSDGTLWAMGDNFSGELGDGTTQAKSTPVLVANHVAAIAAGGVHSLFIKSDGTLWAMGNNYCGQLGDGTAPQYHSTPVLVASQVAAITAGYGHSLFIKSDGTLWSMGRNDMGQLGDGTLTEKHVPVSVANDTAARTANITKAGDYFSLAIMNPPPLPASIVQQPTSQTAKAGQLVIFGVTAAGTMPLGYQWYKGGATLADSGNVWGSTNATLNLSNVRLADAGNYSVVITNAYGSVTSSVASLTVLLPPKSFSGHVVTGGGFQLQFTGTPNYPYILQTATNLTPPVNWQSVFTNPADANGNWIFTVTNLTDLPAGYYRAVGQ